MNETHPARSWRSTARVGSRGRWRVHTEASTYDLDLDADTLMRRAGQSAHPVAGTPVAALAGDGELERLLTLVTCELGQPMRALIRDPSSGRVLWRVPTPVTAIYRRSDEKEGSGSGCDQARPVSLPMVCTCSPEGRAAAEARMRSVLLRIEAGSGHLLPGTVAAQRFLSEVLTSLHVDLRTHLTEVLMDQWFVITAEQLLPDDYERRIVLQADSAEDGIAAIWVFLANEADLQPRSA